MIERCLKKDLKNRYHDISDVRVDMQKVLTDPSGVFVQPITTLKPRTRLRTILPWVAAALVLGAIIAGVAVWELKQAPAPEPHRVIRLDHNLPEDRQLNIDLSGNFGHTLAVSPDGNQFVYSTSKGLYLRSVNELGARLIAGTEENPQSPFFSPDGQWIGYWSQADRKLKKIAIRGGAPVTLCDVSWVFGAIWDEDNTIVYSDVRKGIIRVSANGGTPELLVKGGFISSPQLLPDGKSLIFTDNSRAPWVIVVQSLESGKRKDLFAGDWAHYLPTGHMVYALQNNTNLFAVPFDLRALEVKGGPVPIVEGVYIMFACSNSGTLVYVPGTAPAAALPQRTLVWVDRNGKEEPLEAPPNTYEHPKISPDGKRVALTIQATGGRDIWIWDLVRKTMTRLTFDKKGNNFSLWTPDGKRIVYRSTRDSGFGSVYWEAADGTGEDEKLGSAPDRAIFPWSWSQRWKNLGSGGNV